MPFINAPWALDGTQIPASLARLAQYVATSGSEGIAQLGDLKVAPLETPGNGIRIFSGGAVILNRYQGEVPDQSYMVYNPTGEVLGAGDMPASSPSAKSHLVCVTIGDPEFSAAGHPWMLGTDPPSGEENTFEYVRPFVIEDVPSTTKSFDQLNLNYPGLALARIDLPASTTTVQSSHIVDLRQMAQPRREEVIWHVATSLADQMGSAWEYWPDNSQKLVDIPKWASYVYVTGFVEGARVVFGTAGNQIGSVRAGSQGMGVFTPESHVHIDTPTTTGVAGLRENINFGGAIYIPPEYRGTSQNFQVQGKRHAESSATGSITTDAWTSVQTRLQFVEVPD
jgi:hypothetical protein